MRRALYRWENWDPERLNDLSKVTQLQNNRARIQSMILLLGAQLPYWKSRLGYHGWYPGNAASFAYSGSKQSRNVAAHIPQAESWLSQLWGAPFTLCSMHLCSRGTINNNKCQGVPLELCHAAQWPHAITYGWLPAPHRFHCPRCPHWAEHCHHETPWIGHQRSLQDLCSTFGQRSVSWVDMSVGLACLFQPVFQKHELLKQTQKERGGLVGLTLKWETTRIGKTDSKDLGSSLGLEWLYFRNVF